MPIPTNYTIHQLTPDDLSFMDGLLDTFGSVFDDLVTYSGNRPTRDYTQQLLARDEFIALVALCSGEVVGGLTAYELRKYEQARSEVYIYDLAVAQAHRRRGLATALVCRVTTLAAARGAHAVFVQADTGPEDAAAIALYNKLGRQERVLHFDISVDQNEGKSSEGKSRTPTDS